MSSLLLILCIVVKCLSSLYLYQSNIHPSIVNTTLHNWQHGRYKEGQAQINWSDFQMACNDSAGKSMELFGPY